MKLRVPAAGLAAAVQAAARHLPARPSHPVYAALRLEAAADRLTVTGYDGAVCSTRAALAADVLAEGSTIVPGPLLAHVAAALPGDLVEMALEDAGLTLSAQGGAYLVATCEEHDYPRLPAVPTASGTVAGDLLAEAVVRVRPAVDLSGEAGPAFAGVQLAASGRELVLSGTDRFRIAQQRIAWEPADPGIEAAVVLPAAHLREAVKALGDGDVAVALPASGRLAALSSAAAQITLRTISESFPPVGAAMDKTLDAVGAYIEADAGELLLAARRLRLVAAQDSPLRLLARVDSLTLSAADGTTSRGRERLDARLEGPDEVELRVRAGYLCDALAPLKGGTARLGVPASHKPFVLDGEHVEGYRCLVMPQRDVRAP